MYDDFAVGIPGRLDLFVIWNIIHYDEKLVLCPTQVLGFLGFLINHVSDPDTK